MHCLVNLNLFSENLHVEEIQVGQGQFGNVKFICEGFIKFYIKTKNLWHTIIYIIYDLTTSRTLLYYDVAVFGVKIFIRINW